MSIDLGVRRRRPAGVAGAFLVVVTVAGSSVSGQQPPNGRPAPVPAVAMSANAADALRPGDVVRLRIWREPDLSGDFPVDESGVVVLPKIGPRSVTAESPATLRDTIVAAYSKFLNHNSIDVTLLRRIQVLGAVRQPGVYPVDPTMTIGDVHCSAQTVNSRAMQTFNRDAVPYRPDAPRPGLILLDLNLPRRDGREVLAELKDDPELGMIPVVVLTTSEAEEDIVRSYRLHANAYVSKPVDFDRFIEVVRHIDDFFVTVVKLPR